MASKKALSAAEALRQLKQFGLAYPGAHPKSPWPGHEDVAVNDKTFTYLSVSDEGALKISCKLPTSNAIALSLPFATPTGYGLGKSGWVSAGFAKGAAIPLEMLRDWMDESYRAQAPKKRVAELDGKVKAKAAEPSPIKPRKGRAKTSPKR